MIDSINKRREENYCPNNECASYHSRLSDARRLFRDFPLHARGENARAQVSPGNTVAGKTSDATCSAMFTKVVRCYAFFYIVRG